MAEVGSALVGGHVMEIQQSHGLVKQPQRRRFRRRHDDLGPGGRAELCHDLREPAAAIVMLADAADQESADPLAVRRRLRQILTQARWLATLVEASAEGDEPRLLDLGGLVADCLEPVTMLARATVRVEVGAGGPFVLAPPVALRRAVTNVVANAVRAAGPGGELVVRILDRGDGDIVVEVEDDGPGFGRIPTAHGLGLLITEAALRSMGGGLEISAASSGGARVCVRLPSPARVSLRGPR
jgi:signal transduction histidine kinase